MTSTDPTPADREEYWPDAMRQEPDGTTGGLPTPYETAVAHCTLQTGCPSTFHLKVCASLPPLDPNAPSFCAECGTEMYPSDEGWLCPAHDGPP